MKKTLSLDLRTRIVEVYEAEEGTREEVARRFKVSLGMVKKLLSQWARTGDLRPRHRFSGRKARLLPAHGSALKELFAREPDATLAEMKARLALGCTVAAVHWAVKRLGLTYKKRRSMRSPRPSWSSSAGRRLRQT
jgi:transposase